MQALSGRKMYGRTLPSIWTAWLSRPRINFGHGIWLTDQDIELVAHSGTGIVHNPISNMKLGSGISPVPLLLKAGIHSRARLRWDVVERR